MDEVIVFGDVEAAFVDYLEDELAYRGRPTTVAATIPNPRPPGEFITVTLVGGARRDLVTASPSLMFECWAPLLASKACSLANLTSALVYSARGEMLSGLTVYQVTPFAGPAFVPDPVTDQPRYRFTVSVDVRGSVLS